MILQTALPRMHWSSVFQMRLRRDWGSKAAEEANYALLQGDYSRGGASRRFTRVCRGVSKDAAGQSKAGAQYDQVTEEVKNALRSRAHPLIDLALACDGSYDSTLCPLFECAPPGQAIRLAILSTISIGSGIFHQFPVAGAFCQGLFRDDQEAVGWLKLATPEVLQALFGNRTLADSLFCALCWSALRPGMKSQMKHSGGS
jgi:hypothetical protein